jgi:hypothetical protein
MIFKIKKADDHVVYLSGVIKCKRYRIKVDNDGIVEQVICISRYLRCTCQTCSLVCPARSYKRKKDKVFRGNKDESL